MAEDEERTPYQPVGWTQEQEAIDRLDPANRRPLGVSLLAVLGLAGAILLVGYLIFTPDQALFLGVGGNFAALASPILLFWLWLDVLVGAASSIGLWMLQEWGRWLAISRGIVAILVMLLSSATQNVTGGQLLQVLVTAAIVVYLLRPGVRAVFRTEE